MSIISAEEFALLFARKCKASRYKLFFIPDIVLFKRGKSLADLVIGAVNYLISEGTIPTNTTVTRMYQTPDRHGTCVALESEDFDEVPGWEWPPEIDVPFDKI